MAKEEKIPILELLHETVCKNAKFYKDNSNTYYCKPNGRSIVIPIDSEDFTTYCCSICRTQIGTFIKRDDVKNLRPHLKDDNEVIQLNYYISKRIAYHDDTILIDLMNEQNEIIQINRYGVSFVKGTSLPYFKRGKTMLPMVKPNLSSRPVELLEYIDRHFVIDRSQKILLATWLVCSFISSIQLPLLMVVGSKGSSKSTFTKRIRSILDNNSDQTIMIPSNERDFAVLLDSTYLLTIDNISDGDIKGKFSDIISSAITKNTSYSLRQLYTDNSVVSLHLDNRIILNGISNTLLKKSDSLDRTLLFSLSRIPVDRMVSMKVLDEMFQEDLPCIFGSICNALVEVLNIVDDVDITNISRMTDYTKYGYAVSEVLGIDGDNFLDIYQSNLDSVNELLLQDNVIASCIMQIMQERDILKESVSELYLRVLDVAKASGISQRELPGSPAHFSTRLLEIQSNLKDCNLEVTKKNVGKYKQITIEKIKNT